MPILKVRQELNDGLHFVTLTTQHWYYIFDRHNRWDIILDSLMFCQEKKGLRVFAYVLMLNHLHLLIQCPDIAGFLRDFKKHTSYELMKNMRATESSVAELFMMTDGKYAVWQKTNLPIAIESAWVFEQKKTYIEMNPVRKNYVEMPEHWKYSSAFPGNPLIITHINEL